MVGDIDKAQVKAKICKEMEINMIFTQANSVESKSAIQPENLTRITGSASGKNSLSPLSPSLCMNEIFQSLHKH